MEVEDDDLPENVQTDQNDTFESEHDTLELTAQRWQLGRLQRNFLPCLMCVLPNQLLVLTNVNWYDRVLVLMLTVYTPVLDRFLADLVPKCKTEEKTVRKTQDLLLDVSGPIVMCYEMVLQGKENPTNLSTIMGCPTKSLQLLGKVNDHIRNKRRAPSDLKNWSEVHISL